MKGEKFIIKAEIKYGNQYDYSLVEYKSSEEKVKIKCNKHNIFFEQSPAAHIRGQRGCDLCVGRIDSTDKFIDKAKETHGDKYDYSNSIYVDSTIKVKILCPEHGEFEQLPVIHTKGQGCPKCGIISRCDKKRDNNKTFLEKSQLKHGDKYDYSLVEYVDSKTKVKIICSEHGEFLQSPDKHIGGQGCSKCGKDSLKTHFKKDKETFIRDAISVHGEKYDYSLVEYGNAKTKIKILCPKHGEFEQEPNGHLGGHGCVKCTSSVSKPEIEINDFIVGLGINTIQSSRSIIKPYQLDILIPSHNIAIEHDGLYYHHELRRPNNYHITKTKMCEAKGIQLIHVFGDEWLYKKDIVKSRIRNMLGLNKNSIYGRKCSINEVSYDDAMRFLETNHIQGNVNSSIRLGLYYNNELVSMMTFGSLRKSMGSKSSKDNYELLRFCNKLNTTVVGGASKLFKHFIKTYTPNSLISYADRRWSQGNLYEKLGFEFIHNSAPSYWYINNQKREFRYKYEKRKLVKAGFDNKKSEHEIMLERGIYRIFDCGTKLYIWKSQK